MNFQKGFFAAIQNSLNYACVKLNSSAAKKIL